MCSFISPRRVAQPAGEPSPTDSPITQEVTMKGFWHWLKHEFHAVLPPTIFFLIAFHIVVLNRRLMLREYGLPLASITGATVAALLIGKVVLITDKFPFINRFPDKPLMYNVAWKTVIYVAGAILSDAPRQRRGISRTPCVP